MERLLLIPLWIAATAAMLLAVTLPVSLAAHFFGSAIVLSVMVLLKRSNPEGKISMIALALGSVVVLRYVYWRTTSTIPAASDLHDFLPAILLYGAEMYSVLMLALSLFVVSMPRDSRQSPPLPQSLPTVDVFVPSYDESAELLARTIAAVQNMDYPSEKLTVWLLDDGGTEAKRTDPDPEKAAAALQRHARLKALCADFGIAYLARETNTHAKSGNLNNAMAHSGADLVAVFDADHAPSRDFLLKTVPHLAANTNLALVQTPHFFLNPDPVERNLRTFDRMPGENEMFYARIQRGLDKWNATFFCGSAAVLRRAALAQVGGFATSSITEDCATSVAMHARGWKSAFVDTPMVAGLQPQTFASFIGQRTRWAQGMIQIMLLQMPMFRRGLSGAQRLCYLSSMLFWLFPFSRMIFLVAPLFYIFFDLQIFVASGREFLSYTLTYMSANLLIQNYLYGRYRRPWFSELYEYVQSLHLLPAIVSALLSPRKPSFAVTSKDETVAASRLSPLARPFFFVFAVLVLALAVTAWHLVSDAQHSDILLVVGGWNLLNLIIAGCALGVVAERTEPVSARRVATDLACRLRVAEAWSPGAVRDVSPAGLRIELPASASIALECGSIAEVCMDGVHAPPDRRDAPAPGSAPPTQTPAAVPVSVRRIVFSETGTIIGCRFAPETAEHYRAIASLVFADGDRWARFQQSRREDPGVLGGSLGFIVLAVQNTFRGCRYVFTTLGGDRDPQPRRRAAQSGPS